MTTTIKTDIAETGRAALEISTGFSQAAALKQTDVG